TGVAKIDATVTGNKRDLQAKGNFVGDGIKYGGNGALTAATDFTANVKNLDMSTVSANATTRATFVTLGGQNIDELTATTNYGGEQVDFDANARQPKRTLNVAGSLLLHTEHQEVHLRSLGVQSQGVKWQTAPGSQTTIQYGSDVLTLKDFRLVSGDKGDQQMSVEGTFGRADDALNVTLTNVDIATIDALLLREPQLSGRLQASATISGTKEDLS